MAKALAALALAAAGLFLAAPGAGAADRVVQIRVPPPLRKDMAAMPKIADPVDDAERRINAALDRLDATMRKTKAGCTDDNGRPAEWDRGVDVPMHGPGFLSIEINDTIWCGGRTPSAGTMSIVYDLTTGKPVDWTQLLPPSLTGTVALQQGADGTKMVTLAAKALYADYLAFYRLDDKSDPDQSCQDVVKDAGADAPPAMMAWLDAKEGGLAVQFDLPNVVQACADAVVIPTATLRQAGANPRLLDALDAAHGAQ